MFGSIFVCKAFLQSSTLLRWIHLLPLKYLQKIIQWSHRSVLGVCLLSEASFNPRQFLKNIWVIKSSEFHKPTGNIINDMFNYCYIKNSASLLKETQSNLLFSYGCQSVQCMLCLIHPGALVQVLVHQFLALLLR